MYNCHFACLSAIESVLKLSLHCFFVVTSCIVYCHGDRISCDVYLHKFTFLFFRRLSFQDKVISFSFLSCLPMYDDYHYIYCMFLERLKYLMIFFWHNSYFLFFHETATSRQDKYFFYFILAWNLVVWPYHNCVICVYFWWNICTDTHHTFVNLLYVWCKIYVLTLIVQQSFCLFKCYCNLFLNLSLHCFIVVTSCIVYCQRGWISCDVY